MAFQAIVTKYIGPGNVRGSRVKATASAGSITLAWDDALNSYTNHAKAAEALANKFKWRGNWYSGGMPNSGDMVFVCTSGRFACDNAEAIFSTKGEE